MGDLSIKGTVKTILNPESGTSASGKEWKKQEFVIETDGEYPKDICFALFGDKTSSIEKLAMGLPVEVFFNLESREYNGKFYHNINAWKINEQSSGENNSGSQSIKADDIPPPPPNTDDLPF